MGGIYIIPNSVRHSNRKEKTEVIVLGTSPKVMESGLSYDTGLNKRLYLL